MLAVIKTGGKQYLVKPGDIIDIEKIAGEEGSEVEFSDVLIVSDGEGDVKVGTPVVKSAQVKGTILGEKKGIKITVFKFKRRKGYRKKMGHRQKFTSVKINSIDS
jgi:large subunit ribosomal protein L21